MLPKRISIKFFIPEAPAIDPARLVPVFQRWIQRHSVEGILIDVADYKHVPQGPGVILIGHEGDYSYDLQDDRSGLRYTRKRDLGGDLHNSLRAAFRPALEAAQKLAQEGTLGTKIRFDYGEFEIVFLDRLNTPNTTETFNALHGVLQEFITDLYNTDSMTIERASDDPRQPLVFQVRVAADVKPGNLIKRLEPAAVPAG